MTAINGLVGQDAAYLLADTAIYRPDGRVVGFSTKVTTVPHMRMAFATSGRVEQGRMVADVLMKFTTFHSVLYETTAVLRELWDDEVDGLLRLLIIGWDDLRRRPKMVVMSSREEVDLPAFTFSNAQLIFAPSVHHDVLRDAGLLDAQEQLICSDPTEILTRIVDIQRQRPVNRMGGMGTYEISIDENSIFIVGGHAVITRVDQFRITQRVIRRWPDRVGEYMGGRGDRPKEKEGT